MIEPVHIIAAVTALLLPVFYFSSKWGFETLHQYYMAKVALTEFEKRTKTAEDMYKALQEHTKQLLEQYAPLKNEVTELKDLTQSLRNNAALRTAQSFRAENQRMGGNAQYTSQHIK